MQGSVGKDSGLTATVENLGTVWSITKLALIIKISLQIMVFSKNLPQLPQIEGEKVRTYLSLKS